MRNKLNRTLFLFIVGLFFIFSSASSVFAFLDAFEIPPQAPTNLECSIESNKLTCNWDAVEYAFGYKMYYGFSSGQYENADEGMEMGDNISFVHDMGGSDASNSLNMALFLVVTAYNDAGESDYSNESSATFEEHDSGGSGDLSAPSNFFASIDGTVLTASWYAVEGAESYRLYHGFSSNDYNGFEEVGNATSITFDLASDDVAPGTYFLAVKAVNQNGEESAFSNEQSFTLEGNVGSAGSGDLSAPINFTASMNSNILTVSWDAVEGASGYKLYHGESSANYNGIEELGNITNAVFDLNDEEVPAGTYFIVITAYDDSGESSYSNEVSIIVE